MSSKFDRLGTGSQIAVVLAIYFGSIAALCAVSGLIVIGLTALGAVVGIG